MAMPDYSNLHTLTSEIRGLGEVALFLDIDGTLLEIQEHPEAVVVEPGLLETLQDLLRKMQGALALVTGRSAQQVDRLFGSLPVALAAQHGAELRKADGQRLEKTTASPLERIEWRKMLKPANNFVEAHSGCLLEEKQQGFALHYRQAAEAEAEVKQFMQELVGSQGEGYELIFGKMVVEVKPAGKNKGWAIQMLLEEDAFAGRVPVFIGDDVTDEDGFAALQDEPALTIKVGEGDTLAKRRIADVAEVRQLLAQLRVA